MTLRWPCAERVVRSRCDLRPAVLGTALLVALSLAGCDRPSVAAVAAPEVVPVPAVAAPASAVSIYELATPKRLP
jgi:hypothetical protein